MTPSAPRSSSSFGPRSSGTTSLVEKPLVDEVATTGFWIASVLVLKRVTDVEAELIRKSHGLRKVDRILYRLFVVDAATAIGQRKALDEVFPVA